MKLGQMGSAGDPGQRGQSTLGLSPLKRSPLRFGRLSSFQLLRLQVGETGNH